MVRQEVVSNSKDVEVGNFDTNQFDISDVQQFDKAGKGGSTTAGALIHETIEPLDKANQGMGPGESLTSAKFDQAYQKASKAEDKVNRDTRGGDDSEVSIVLAIDRGISTAGKRLGPWGFLLVAGYYAGKWQTEEQNIYKTAGFIAFALEKLGMDRKYLYPAESKGKEKVRSGASRKKSPSTLRKEWGKATGKS